LKLNNIEYKSLNHGVFGVLGNLPQQNQKHEKKIEKRKNKKKKRTEEEKKRRKEGSPKPKTP